MNDNVTKNNDSTKDKILQTAIVEFAEFGQAGARVDRIAEKAGVNKAMIYYHFSSKENLYYYSITDHIAKATQGLQRRITSEKSLEEIIGGIIEEHMIMFGSSPYFRKIMIRELAEEDSPVVKKIAEIISQSGVPNILYNKLLSAMENGQVKKMDIKQAIASLISMNFGFFIISPVSSRILNIVEFDKFVAARKDAVVDLFLNGVLAK